MDEATRLFNKVFFALTGTWADTVSFRQIVLGGLPQARQRLLEQNARWFEQFVNDLQTTRFSWTRPSILRPLAASPRLLKG